MQYFTTNRVNLPALAFAWHLIAFASFSYGEPIKAVSDREQSKISMVMLNARNPSDAKSIEWLFSKAKHGEPEAQFIVGKAHYEAGYSETTASKYWLDKSYANGYLPAGRMLAAIMLNNEVTVNFRTFKEHLESIAKHGDPDSEFILGAVNQISFDTMIASSSANYVLVKNILIDMLVNGVNGQNFLKLTQAHNIKPMPLSKESLAWFSIAANHNNAAARITLIMNEMVNNSFNNESRQAIEGHLNAMHKCEDPRFIGMAILHIGYYISVYKEYDNNLLLGYANKALIMHPNDVDSFSANVRATSNAILNSLKK